MSELVEAMEAIVAAIRKLAIETFAAFADAFAELGILLGTRPYRPTDNPAWRRAARGIDSRMLSPRWTYQRSYPR